MNIVRLLKVIGAFLFTILLSVALTWLAFSYQDKLRSVLGWTDSTMELASKPIFKPLEKFVISLENGKSSHYLLLELTIVTHDPKQPEILENLSPVMRNALVQHFTRRSLEEVRSDLQQIDELQQVLHTKLTATISNYGFQPALDEVLVTKVVLQ